VSDVDRERARRIGLNESVFRRVNEQIEALSERLGQPFGRPLDLICECGNIDCAERIQMRPDLYERLRGDPVLFAVVPGHERPEVEEVVSKAGGYDVVRKRPGVPEQVARETDTRGQT
jgi:hypothetical protein